MSYLDRTDTFIASLGLEAYRVGGSVRDEVLGRKAKDADYMIRGVPLKDLGRVLRVQLAYDGYRDAHTKPLVLRDGRQSGWRVSGRGLGCIEIVLPRTDVSTGPGHRDFEIVLDPNLSLEEDAKRRDFTFNALYRIVHHPEGLTTLIAGPGGAVYENIVDPTGNGLEDLARQRINVTHADSFRDDPLRTLRALRFVSTLGYDLGRETRALMTLHAEHVSGLTSKGYVSGTMLDEFSKLLMGQNPAKALRIARDTGVLGVALPELKPMLGFEQGSRYHDMTTDEHTFTALETAAHVDAPLRVRWALLFHDSGKPQTAWVGKDGRKHYYAQPGKQPMLVDPGDGRHYNLDHETMGELIWREAARSLQADKRLREDVATLIRNHMVPVSKVRASKVRRARIRLGDDMLRDLYLMRMCDLSAKGGGHVNRDHMRNIGQMEAERARCEAAGVPAKAAELEISGHDVRELGAEGRDIGRVLNSVLDEVACDPSTLKMSRDWQMQRAAAAVKSGG